MSDRVIIGRNGNDWWLEKHKDALVLLGPCSQRQEYPLSYEAALMDGMTPTDEYLAIRVTEPSVGQPDQQQPRSETSSAVKRPFMRHPPCAVECRADGKAVYALIGNSEAALTGQPGGVIGFGDTLADALRALANEIEKEVEVHP